MATEVAVIPDTKTGKTVSPPPPGRCRGSGELDLNPAGAAGKPKEKNKALPYRRSSNRNAYAQKPFASALDASQHISSLLERLTLSLPDKRDQGVHEDAGDLKFVGTWTPQLSRSSGVANTIGQYVNSGGDMALCKQCPYHHRNHDAEPINVILYQRSLHRATTPNCTCQGNYSI